LQGVFAAAVGIVITQSLRPGRGRRFNFCHNVIFALPAPGQKLFYDRFPQLLRRRIAMGYTTTPALRV